MSKGSGVLSPLRLISKFQKNNESEVEKATNEIGEKLENIALEKRWTQLHDAAYKGDFDEIKKILQQEPSLLNIQEEGFHKTILHVIIELNKDIDQKVEIIKYLLDNYEVNLFLGDKNGWFPIHYAAKLERGGQIIELLLKKDPELIKAQEHFQKTAAHISIKFGTFEIFQHLIEQNSKILDIGDQNGWLPIHYAAMTDKRAQFIDAIYEVKQEFLTICTSCKKTPTDIAREYKKDSNLQKIADLLNGSESIISKVTQATIVDSSQIYSTYGNNNLIKGKI